jgi:hypothetical protein
MTRIVPRLGARESPTRLIEGEARRRKYGQVSARRVDQGDARRDGSDSKADFGMFAEWVSMSAFTEMDERSLNSR